MSGIDIAYLPARVLAMSGTDTAYDATRCPVVTQCLAGMKALLKTAPTAVHTRSQVEPDPDSARGEPRVAGTNCTEIAPEISQCAAVQRASGSELAR